MWSRSGRELFYLDEEGRLATAVNVQSSPSFVASTPVRLLDRAYLFHSVCHPGRTLSMCRRMAAGVIDDQGSGRSSAGRCIELGGDVGRR